MGADDDDDAHNFDAGEPPRKKQARSFRFENISQLNPLGVITTPTSNDNISEDTSQPPSSDEEEEDRSSSPKCLRLVGQPAYLFEILQPCDNGSIIWIGEDSFVALDRTIPVQRGFEHRILLNQPTRLRRYRIQARSMTRAVDILDLLLSLSILQPNPSKINILPEYQRSEEDDSNDGHDDDNGEEFQACPMAESDLERFLIGHKHQRKHQYIFTNTIFTVAQSRVLATKGRFVNLWLANCRFVDQGEEFVLAHQERQQGAMEEVIDLTLEGPSIVFSPRYWSEFLHVDNVTLQLALVGMELSEAHCAAFSSTSFDYLDVGVGTRLDDSGKALSESIRTKLGPRRLGMTFECLQNIAGWTPFFEAMGSDSCRLRQVEILCPSFWDRMTLEEQNMQQQWMEKLAAAIHKNTSLEAFCCTNACLDGFVNIYKAVQNHPTMTSVGFRSEFPRDFDVRKHHMKLIGEMVRHCKTLESLQFFHVFFQQGNYYDKHIEPHLTCNRYRKLFLQYHPSYVHRDATLAVALGNLSAAPSLLWMLLSDHHDAFATNHCSQKQQYLLLSTDHKKL